MALSEMPSKTSSSTAWLVVGLLFPVALLNYLDRQMIASMKASVVADIAMAEVGAEPERADPDEDKSDQAESVKADSQAQQEPASRENTNWGHMLGQFKWVYAIFSPIGGYLADRLSRRYTICASLAVWSLITCMTGMATTYEQLLWTRTLMGVSEAFYIPAALALIADYHQGSTRSKAIGIHQMGIYCGVILGGFAGYAADSESIGWRGAFSMIGVIGIVYAVPLFLVLRDVQHTPSTDDSTAVEGYSLGNSLVQLFTNGSFLLLVAYFTLPGLAAWVIRDWMPSILKDSFQIGQGQAGVSATIYWMVAAIVAAFVGGAVADYWMRFSIRGRIYVSAIGMSLLIPALMLVGSAIPESLPSGAAQILTDEELAKRLQLAIMALVLFGVGWGFFDCNSMPILCQIVRPELRATGYGIMNLVGISCGGFADKIFGVLRDSRVPMSQIFQTFALISVVCVVLVLLIRPRPTETNVGA